jgi:hypothetical protein
VGEEIADMKKIVYVVAEMRFKKSGGRGLIKMFNGCKRHLLGWRGTSQNLGSIRGYLALSLICTIRLIVVVLIM